MDQTSRLAAAILICMVFVLVHAGVGAVNLLVNGDFSLGNTGFTSAYVFTSDTVPEGTYCVDTDPHNCHLGAASYNDHTSGSGLMLNVNGAVSPDRIVWQQAVAVVPDTQYTFSGWVASWGKVGGDILGIDPSPAQLRVFINEAPVGQDVAVSAQNGQWFPFAIHWNSASNTSATITMVDVNVEGFGNDFSLDDLRMSASTFPPLVNDRVAFDPIDSTFFFTPDDPLCPEGFVGTFSFDARLTNISALSLSNLVVEVTELTGGNLLQNADGGPGNTGAHLTVSEQGAFADGVLSPDEFVDVPFRICLQERQPFRFIVNVLGRSPGQACVQPPEGLVSWWPGEGDATDISDGNTGMLINGVTFTPGMVGQAFLFDGIDDRINVADADNLHLTESVTIEAWIAMTSLPEPTALHGQIFFRGDDRAGLDPYYFSVQPNGTIRFHIESLTEAVNLEAPISTNRFVHVAGTLEAMTGVMRIYLDGHIAAETTTTIRPLRDLAPSANPGIGIGNHGGFPTSPFNQRFHGIIDELAIYTRALSSDEIAAIFVAGSAGKCQDSSVAVGLNRSP